MFKDLLVIVVGGLAAGEVIHRLLVGPLMQRSEERHAAWVRREEADLEAWRQWKVEDWCLSNKIAIPPSLPSPMPPSSVPPPSMR